MLNRFPRLLTIVALTTITTVFATKVTGQQVGSPPPVTADTITPAATGGLDKLINKAYSQRSGDFFDQASASGQLNFLYGWGDFPVGTFSENNVAKDGQFIKVIVEDYFKQLTQREPDIRSRDIENPFNSSLQQNPDYTSD